jgi:hypothetical protein
LSWSAPVTEAVPVGMPTGISCPQTTFCMAVDGTGRAVEYNGHWDAPVRVAAPGTTAKRYRP